MIDIEPNEPQKNDGFVAAPQPAYSTPSQQPAKKSKVWVVVLVVALVLLCCCCAIAGVVKIFILMGPRMRDFTFLSPLLTLL